MGWRDEKHDLRSEVMHGDVMQVLNKSILFAIQGETDDTIYIPLSVIVEPSVDDLEIEDDIDLIVEKWWYDKNEERFS